jgi:hypothetical protein
MKPQHHRPWSITPAEPKRTAHGSASRLVISSGKERTMNEDVLNTNIRKFLKVVGVTSQREIEKAVRAAIGDGRIKGNDGLAAKVTLTVSEIDLTHSVDGRIELE